MRVQRPPTFFWTARFAFPVVFGFFCLLMLAQAKDVKRKIRVRNSSPSLLTVYWVNPNTKEYIQQYEDDLFPGASNNINSFVTHEFAVVEVVNGCLLADGRRGGGKLSAKHLKSKKKSPTLCNESRFVVGEGDDQVILVTGKGEDFKAVLLDSFARSTISIGSTVDSCLDALSESPADTCGDQESQVAYADKVKECLTNGLMGTLQGLNDDLRDEKIIRKAMAPLIEDYTCSNDNLNQTEPIKTTDWRYSRPSDGTKEKPRKVEIMFSNHAAEIHVIQDFITPEECQAIEEVSKPLMHRASVASEDGGSKFSPNRKAMQAGIKVDWAKEVNGDHIARLSRRVFDYTNDHSDLNLNIDGQEDIMAIHYFGRGKNDTEPDRYMPHCDGDCEGDEFRAGTRVATMVIYCTVPTAGGATNFAQSNIHVKPKVGSATWFKYVSSLDTLPNGDVVGVMDSGFTQHSGCPVLEGEKKIVTQWMRKGVSSDEPWNSFNTMGVSKKKVAKLLESNDKENEGWW